MEHSYDSEQQGLLDRQDRVLSEMFDPDARYLSSPTTRNNGVNYLELIKSPVIIFSIGLIVGIAFMEIIG